MADDRVDIVRQVKEASDIADVVGSYLTLHGSGPVFKSLCPFHNDNRPSFDVDQRRQRYRCWSCGAMGDVFNFVQEFDKVDFREALEVLARRAGISLQPGPNRDSGKVRLYEAVRWAAEAYQDYLLNAPDAEAARRYIGERGFAGATTRQFGLGFAPLAGDWFAKLARRQGVDIEALVEVGVLGRRQESGGFYDKFRDRVMFPIRDMRGRPVGFGGRILPSSPYSDRAPKYYNSAETPLFAKSELLYGLDLARKTATDAGYLAVVEGYTDVMMAHQAGVSNTVATMGTALTAAHVRALRRHAPRVVLVFDSDAGGLTGVDRALELFISQDVELAIAVLPDSLDPFDFLTRRGADDFRAVLEKASDALDFKLSGLLSAAGGHGLDAQRRVIDGVLGVMAMAPEMPGQAGRVKQELAVTRVAHRLGLKQETVWARQRELRNARRRQDAKAQPEPPQPSAGPASPLERQLISLLLAEPDLVSRAVADIPPALFTHPGLRKVYECLADLLAEGQVPDLDALRVRMNHPALVAKVMELQDRGRLMTDRAASLGRIAAAFERERVEAHRRHLSEQLSRAQDPTQAMDLLRQLQNLGGGRQPAGANSAPTAADLAPPATPTQPH